MGDGPQGIAPERTALFSVPTEKEEESRLRIKKGERRCAKRIQIYTFRSRCAEPGKGGVEQLQEKNVRGIKGRKGRVGVVAELRRGVGNELTKKIYEMQCPGIGNQ